MMNYQVIDQQFLERLCITNRKRTNSFVIYAEWWSQLPVSFELMPPFKSNGPSPQIFPCTISSHNDFCSCGTAYFILPFTTE